MPGFVSMPACTTLEAISTHQTAITALGKELLAPRANLWPQRAGRDRHRIYGNRRHRSARRLVDVGGTMRPRMRSIAGRGVASFACGYKCYKCRRRKNLQ